VRFAPSPTGFLHVGGARTALFNWLLARKKGGTFILRIEDTDRERSTPEMTQAILDSMAWLGLDWDEGPLFQSDGIERHRADVRRLLDDGLAYRDFTTSEELARDREELQRSNTSMRAARRKAEAMAPGEAEERAAAGEVHAVRFRVPHGETVWNDTVHGEMRFANDEIDDLVILRSDGSPTYNLAVVSDDADMRVTLVIRGDDHLSNTPKQILLHEALGHTPPTFAHVPMILGPDGKRLSKRHGATAVGEYEGQGILPDAMVNFLALLGWSPGDDREVMTRAELLESFTLERVLKKSAVFDVKKLEWLNGQHLSRTSAAELEPGITKRLVEGGKARAEELAAREAGYLGLIDLLKVRARTLDELAEQVAAYLPEEVEYDPQAVAKHWEKNLEAALEYLTRMRGTFEACQWEEESLEEALRSLAESLGKGAGKLIHPLRVALTGQAVSPGIFEVLVVIGRERSLARIEEAIRLLGARSPARDT
ncbi:MAG: glutamate--tRNA ligase, partial [Gemmatimonadota bacterium]